MLQFLVIKILSNTVFIVLIFNPSCILTVFIIYHLTFFNTNDIK